MAEIEVKETPEAALTNPGLTEESIRKIVAEVLASTLKAQKPADDMVNRVALPPELQIRSKLIDVAKNGAKNDEEKGLLVAEYFRHKFIGPSWDFRSEVPLNQVRKALTTTGSGAGADLIATEYMTEAIRALANIAVFKPYVRVFTMTQNTLDWPVVVNGHTANYRSENAAIAATTATTSNVTLTAKTLAARTEQISREVVADSRFPLIPYVSELLSEAMKLKEQSVFVTGSTSATPYGIANLGFTSLAQAGSALAYDDIIKLKHTLGSAYRRRAGAKRVFFGNDACLKLLRLIKTDDGLPILVDANAEAMTMVCGEPFIELPDITGAGTSGSKTTLHYGDYNLAYYWGEMQNMEFESTTEADNNFSQHSIQIKAVARNDGQGADTSAAVKLTGVYM